MDKVKEKKRYVAGIMFILCFVAGICAGAMVCVYTNENSNREIYEYLSDFFGSFSTVSDIGGIIKKSLAVNSKIFAVILVSAMFAAGYAISAAVVTIKGFVTGFTMTAFIKFYAINGIWLALCNLPVNLLFIPTVIFYAVVSAGVSIKCRNGEKGIIPAYLLISVGVYIIFVLCACMDGYITASAMKLVLHKLLNCGA